MEIGYNASVQTRSKISSFSLGVISSLSPMERSLRRYFEGIQGDTTKKGELFGIENIFKFHGDKLATKMAVQYHSTPSNSDFLTPEN